MRPLVPLLAVVALATAACDSGSDSAAERTTATTPPAATTEPPAETAAAGTTTEETPEPGRQFKKADLQKIALQASDRPQGMRYADAESGPRSFFDAGIVAEEQEAEARQQKLRAVHDTIFDSTTTDVRIAVRYWLFADSDGARYWFQKSRRDASQFFFEEFSAPRLGNESWAAGADLGGTLVITHAFRAGNVFVVVTQSTSTEEPSQEDTLAVAQLAADRIAGA